VSKNQKAKSKMFDFDDMILDDVAFEELQEAFRNDNAIIFDNDIEDVLTVISEIDIVMDDIDELIGELFNDENNMNQMNVFFPVR
jgi:hypothetical protein